MNARALVDLAFAGATCTLTTFALVRLAPHLGLVDDASDAPDRKLHARPVPLVGGTAIAVSIALLVAWRGVSAVGGEVVHGVAIDPRAVLAALAVAFAIGLVDDVAPRGLPALLKLAGQIAAGLALARGLQISGAAATFTAQAGCVAAAVVAQNAANAFDNADGALTAVASAGLACASFVCGTPFAGATLAFLPWNLLRRPAGPQGDSRPEHVTTLPATTPHAWLGDSGSHLIGILLLTTPVAWAALALPVLDLVRVVVVRLRAGEPVWRGDRRHWAHMLQNRGYAPAAVVGWLVLAALPPLVLATICAF